MSTPNPPFPGLQLVDGNPQNSTELVMDHLKEFTLSTTVTTALQCCIITHFFYYCVLHFSEEVEYIWSRSWTFGKVIYLMSRYTGSIFLVLITITILPLGWNDIGKELIGGQNLELLVKDPCFGGYLYIVAGTAVFALAEVISAWRVYAIYGRKKRIVVLSIILMMISAAGTQFLGAVYLIAPSESCIGTRCLFGEPVSFRVTGSCTVLSWQITVFSWFPMLFVELVFFCLVLWKIRQTKGINGDYNTLGGARKKRTHTRDIMTLMAHDSKKYFLWINLMCFIGTCLSISLIVENFKLEGKGPAIIFLLSTLGNAFATLAISVFTIMAPELFLNIRIEYYGPVGSLVDKSYLSWDVAIPCEISDVDHQCLAISGRGQYSIVEDQEPEDAAET